MHTVIEMGLVMLVGQPERPPPPTPEFEVIARHDVSVHEFKRQPNHPAAIQQTGGGSYVLSGGIGGGGLTRGPQKESAGGLRRKEPSITPLAPYFSQYALFFYKKKNHVRHVMSD